MKRIRYSVYTDTNYNNLYGYLIEDQDYNLQFVTSDEEDLEGRCTSECITINSDIFINAIKSSTKHNSSHSKQLNKNSIFCTESTLEIPYQNTISTFTTERYIVDKLYNTVLEQLQCIKSNSRHNCTTLRGLRRIGKTTALYQLYNKLSLLDLRVCYIDLSDNSLYDFIDSTEDVIQIYLLDEICKLSENKLYSLINKIKNYKKNVFVITGSVASKLDEISDKICDGYSYSLRSIMFLENLAWENHCDFKSALRYTTNEKYLEFLKSSNLTDKINTTKMLTGIVTDTLDSYSKQVDNAYADYVQLTKSRNLEIFYYIILCQYVYCIKNKEHKHYKDIDAGVTSNKNDITGLLETLREYKKQLKNKDIQLYCKMLEDAELLKLIYSYNENFIEPKPKETLELWEEGYVFEYPQIFNYIFDTDVSESLENLWVECSILNKLYDFYNEVGKLRESTGFYEVYYTEHYKHNIIEVKNQPEENTQIRKYRKVVNALREVNTFIVSCNNVVYKETNHYNIYRMRNDVIVVLLELALINDDSRNLTVLDLYNKYKELL